MEQQTVLLSQSDIESLIGLDTICEVVEKTFHAHGLGQVTMPAKITLNINPVDHQAWMNAMPAYVAPLNAAGIKWAGGFVNNPRQHGLPYVMATIILNDPVTGQNLAVLDGAYITNARTGAAGAISARYTARPESSVVTIIGAGVQAHWVLRSLRRYFQLREVRIVDINPEALKEYVTTMGAETGLPIIPVSSGDEAARDADIIFTVTTANMPLIQNTSIGPGTTVVSMGSYQELDDAFVLSADSIFVDSTEQCLHRGELARLVEQGRLSETDIDGELGELVAGKKPGRGSPTERILVVPIGLGSFDIAIARKALGVAKEKGVGGLFSFSA